jgi:DNA-binding ferritin-like protein
MNSTKNKKQLEWALFEHFQEIHFQVDEHREKLKEKIDDIALDVINETKKYEKNSFKIILKEKEFLFETSSFDDRKGT